MVNNYYLHLHAYNTMPKLIGPISPNLAKILTKVSTYTVHIVIAKRPHQ